MCIKGISGRDAYEIPYLFKDCFNNGYEITGDGFLNQPIHNVQSICESIEAEYCKDIHALFTFPI